MQTWKKIKKFFEKKEKTRQLMMSPKSIFLIDNKIQVKNLGHNHAVIEVKHK